MASPRLVLTSQDPLSTGAGVLAVPAYAGAAGPEPGPGADAAATALGIDLPAHLAAEKATGEPGEVVALPTFGRLGAVRTVLVVGLGARDATDPARYRKAGAAVVRKAGKVAVIATTIVDGAAPDAVTGFAEGVLLAAYGFGRRSEPKPDPLERVDLVVRAGGPKVEAALERGRVRATATTTVRDLANTPSIEKDPAWLAKTATRLARGAGIGCRVVEPPELVARGFGGILAVGSGSARGPRLIELQYEPPGGARRHVVLVGKGITFDSGGLSIKTNDGMVTMKTDMAGGAVVIATLAALPALGVRTRVTGLVPAAENMPSGTAVRPGDVIRHYGGRTVEVLNTDAEGRLVLADALAYAVAELRPDYLVDVATLTGAIGIALGKRTAGLFSNDDRLADALLAAAGTAGERLWRMPLVEDYRSDLDSPVADLKNIGGKFQGGSITAALFLREFVGRTKWAHLDIASAARSDTEEDEVGKGATGFGARTLLTWLASL